MEIQGSFDTKYGSFNKVEGFFDQQMPNMSTVN